MQVKTKHTRLSQIIYGSGRYMVNAMYCYWRNTAAATGRGGACFSNAISRNRCAEQWIYYKQIKLYEATTVWALDLRTLGVEMLCVESSEKCTGCLCWFPTVWPQRAALPHSLSHSHAEDKWQRHGVSGDWEWGGWGMWLANKNGPVTVWIRSNQRPEQSLMDTFNIYERPLGVQHLAQGHFGMQVGKTKDWTPDLSSLKIRISPPLIFKSV